MTDEQKRWLEKARESLSAAEVLEEKRLYSSATSRAYYAMFAMATALLLGKGLRFKSHAAVIAAFGKHFAATGQAPREFHRYLINVFDERIVADYETEQEFTAEDVAETIEHARQFFGQAEQLLNAK